VSVYVIHNWNGTMAREQTFEQNIENLRIDANPEACVVHLQRQMLEAIGAMRAYNERASARGAIMERNAREKIAREALR
jgi:hypothetical protein